MSNTVFAFDRASMRSFDEDGRLHVEMTNISKAAVNPYYGREIPDWQRLGLSRDKIYHLLRHPDELAKGAASFNNLPILSQHEPVTADEHHPKLVIGSTGTDAAFEDGYLRNSAVFWARDWIDKIEDETQKELSSAYRYRAEMIPGKWEGLPYDGIMRDIVGNHVALVDEGRAGPDVVVADRKPEMLKTRRAIMLHGALAAHISPKLAQDSKLELAGVLKGVTDKTEAKGLAKAVVAMAKPKLAQDEGLDADDVCKIIEAVQGEHVDGADEEIELETEIDEIAEDEDSPREDVIADLMDYIRDRLPSDEYEHAAKLVRREATMDEDPKDDDSVETAMDRATVTRMIADAEARGAKRQAAIEQAREDVKPLVGRLIGMDSAGEIYRTALKAKGYDDDALSGAKVATLQAMCKREIAMADKPRVAMDRQAVKTNRERFNERFHGVK